MSDPSTKDILQISPDDVEFALSDYPYAASLLNAYFTNVSYDRPMRVERDLALLLMRIAWVKALTPHIGATAARDLVMQQEFYARDIMNTVDRLSVSPMAWCRSWGEE